MIALQKRTSSPLVRLKIKGLTQITPFLSQQCPALRLVYNTPTQSIGARAIKMRKSVILIFSIIHAEMRGVQLPGDLPRAIFREYFVHGFLPYRC